MPPGGYILLSRKFFESWLWTEEREFSRAEAFQDLVIGAAWAPYSRTVKGHVIAFERGEVLGSLRYLAERWGWSVKRVRVFVAQLEKKGTLRAQRETQAGHVYLLVNYDSYQSNGHGEGTAPDATRAQRGHTEGTPRAQRKTSEVSETSEDKEEEAPSAPAPPRERARRVSPELPPIPEELDTPEFRAALAGRLDERAARGAKARPTGPQLLAQFRQLAAVAREHGIAVAVECLEYATAGGYPAVVYKDRLPGANGNGKNGYKLGAFGVTPGVMLAERREMGRNPEMDKELEEDRLRMLAIRERADRAREERDRATT